MQDPEQKEIQPEKPGRVMSRKDFLKGLGISAVNLAILGACGAKQDLLGNEETPQNSDEKAPEIENNPKEADSQLEGMFDKNKSDLIAFIPEDSTGAWEELKGNKLTVESISKDPRMRAALAMGAVSSAADGPLPIGEAILVVGAGYVLCRIIAERGEEVIQVVRFEPNAHSKERRGEALAHYVTNEVETAFSNPNPDDNRRKEKICGIARGVRGIGKVVIYALEMESINKPGIMRTAAVVLGQRLTGGNEIVHITTLYSRTKFDNFLQKQEKVLDNLVRQSCKEAGPFGPDDPSFSGP